jgi:hypothetical protein
MLSILFTASLLGRSCLAQVACTCGMADRLSWILRPTEPSCPRSLTMPTSQVSDLEEERRKLRLEMKFRAKYHGAAALELGLSPEQLLLVEQYVEGLRTGRSSEGNLVSQLQKRVRGGDISVLRCMLCGMFCCTTWQTASLATLS